MTIKRFNSCASAAWIMGVSLLLLSSLSTWVRKKRHYSGPGEAPADYSGCDFFMLEVAVEEDGGGGLEAREGHGSLV